MNREILRIALPNIISNITVPLMGIISTIIAGHCSDDSVTTIGALAIGVSIFNLIYWNSAFVRMGTSGFTAQAYGAGDFQECTNMLARSLVTSALLGVLMLLLQYPVGELALWMMNGGELTSQYFYARVWAVPGGIMIFGFNGWFTGMQNGVYPMYIALTVNIVHLALSLWFVFGLDMNIVGLAYASVVSQYCGVGLATLLLLKKYRSILTEIDWCEVANVEAIKQFFGVNRDIMVRNFCLVVVYTFFTAISARMGSDIILMVNTLLLQMFTLFSYMNDGFAYASEALTGRFIGARDSISLRKCVKWCLVWGTIVSVIFVVIYVVWWRDIISIFIAAGTPNKEQIIATAGEFIGWIIVIPIASAFPFIIDGIMVGGTQTGIMRRSMLLSTIIYFALYYGFNYFIGNNALWLAFTSFMLFRGLIQLFMTRYLKDIYLLAK